jgi:lipopolysaccharide export system permease protein
MKLVGYVLKKFFGIFIAAMMFFIMILELVSLFANLWSYINRGVTIDQIAQLMLYYAPRCAWYSIPMSMLFATAYMLSDLYAKNELLAIFASGISLLRFTLPLLIFSIFASIGLFFFEDRVVVKYQAKYDSMQEEVLHKKKSLNNEDVIVIAEAGRLIYNVGFYDSELKRIYQTYVIFRNDDMTLDGIAYIDTGLWISDQEEPEEENKVKNFSEESGHWEISNTSFYQMKDGQYETRKLPPEYASRLIENPSTFQTKTVSVTQVTAKEAREYIEHLDKAGLPSQEAKAEYYKKFAFPFIVFIVVFLAIGLSGKTRKNVLLISLALSISAVVVFYVTQMVTMLMATYGVIPPVMGEWLPILLFTGISIVLLRYTRT